MLFLNEKPSSLDKRSEEVVHRTVFAFLVGWLVWGLTALRDSISVYIEPSPKEREKEERKDR